MKIGVFWADLCILSRCRKSRLKNVQDAQSVNSGFSVQYPEKVVLKSKLNLLFENITGKLKKCKEKINKKC